MQSSDVSAYLNLSATKDLAPKRPDNRPVQAPAAAAVPARIDTTSVSAGARALTASKQAEVASHLPVERIQQLRQARPDPDKIAAAILRAELDDAAN